MRRESILAPRLIGASRATWMLLTGESIDAFTAHDWGLVHEVCAPEAHDARIGEVARKLAGYGSAVLRQQKAQQRSWESLAPDQAIEATVVEFGRAFATGEPQKYMERFKNRRR